MQSRGNYVNYCVIQITVLLKSFSFICISLMALTKPHKPQSVGTSSSARIHIPLIGETHKKHRPQNPLHTVLVVLAIFRFEIFDFVLKFIQQELKRIVHVTRTTILFLYFVIIFRGVKKFDFECIFWQPLWPHPRQIRASYRTIEIYTPLTGGRM